MYTYIEAAFFQNHTLQQVYQVKKTSKFNYTI